MRNSGDASSGTERRDDVATRGQRPVHVTHQHTVCRFVCIRTNKNKFKKKSSVKHCWSETSTSLSPFPTRHNKKKNNLSLTDAHPKLKHRTETLSQKNCANKQVYLEKSQTRRIHAGRLGHHTLVFEHLHERKKTKTDTTKPQWRRKHEG